MRWVRSQPSTTTTPEKASRAYDAHRDGFVIAGGGGCLVLEELEHAKARGAKIYAELVGYGATSDGYDMVAPSGEGATRCMQQAMATVTGSIDYINAHGTSTPVGDLGRTESSKSCFWRCYSAHQLHQIPVWPFARRGRRAGSNLLTCDAATQLHCGFCQY
jgi:3-oxoacyl-(acyl-carrier-protein) synthase